MFLVHEFQERWKGNERADLQQAKEHMKLEKLPALLVFKGGKEVERLYAPEDADMKALAERLFS